MNLSVPPTGPGLNITGLTTWVQNNVLGLLVLIVGCIIILHGRKKNMGDALTIVAIVFLGLIVVGLSINGTGAKIGQNAATFIFG